MPEEPVTVLDEYTVEALVETEYGVAAESDEPVTLVYADADAEAEVTGTIKTVVPLEPVEVVTV